MSGYDDDGRDMTGGRDFDTGGGSSGAGPGAAVVEFIDDLRAIADEEPPQPSAELAAVLAGTALPSRVRRRSPARAVAAVAACAVLAGAGTAAANGRLPQPAQRVVSDVVDTLTPFRVPAHSGDDQPGRTVPEQPARRPVVGPPPGADRRSHDEGARDGSPSAEQESPGADDGPTGRPTAGASRSGGSGEGDGQGGGAVAAQPSERESSGDYGARSDTQDRGTQDTGTTRASGGDGGDRGDRGGSGD